MAWRMNVRFENHLQKTLPKSIEELMAQIEKYARVEEDTSGTKAPRQEKRNGSPKRGRGNTGFNRQERRLRAAQAITIVFRIPVYKVLERIRNQLYYRALIPGEFMRRSLGKHCTYHNEDGYLTQGCRALKTHLEDLVRQGHLRDLVDEARMRKEQARLSQASAAPPLPPLPPPPPQQADGPQVINVIHSKVNKNDVRGETHRVRHLHVNQDQQKKPRTNEYQGPVVSFTEADLDMVQHPHIDALVITLKIGECQVRRILVDQGSSCNIMYVRCYKELGLHLDDLEQSNSPMVGFDGTPTWPLGAMNLEVQTDTKKSTYNVREAEIDEIEDEGMEVLDDVGKKPAHKSEEALKKILVQEDDGERFFFLGSGLAEEEERELRSFLTSEHRSVCLDAL
ncbi:uncharacterized protein LOC114260634 [Camellia sinensis]|uniref:uncharacterized protein LOC114260634 n=1 Tax=Camellia sinensis TaxID=4442 RepID=UPI001035DDE9|nr:uncharacterized protein LOC114260634 [Camellia sinensis]